MLLFRLLGAWAVIPTEISVILLHQQWTYNYCYQVHDEAAGVLEIVDA